MVATANKSMERYFRMLREKVHPDWVITRLKTRTSKVVWIDAGREAVALIVEVAVETQKLYFNVLRMINNVKYARSELPIAYFAFYLGPRNQSFGRGL